MFHKEALRIRAFDPRRSLRSRRKTRHAGWNCQREDLKARFRTTSDLPLTLTSLARRRNEGNR